MTKRSVGMGIVLSILTCGLYSIYWIYVLIDDYCDVLQIPREGGKYILLSIVTCGLYSIYFSYKMGERVEFLSGKNDAIMYLLCSIFGLGIINVAVWQNEMNTWIDGGMGTIGSTGATYHDHDADNF